MRYFTGRAQKSRCGKCRRPGARSRNDADGAPIGLQPLIEGRVRSAFFMTEPAADGGAGSDPSMMQTSAHRDGSHWVIFGRKTFITGAQGARVGIIMAKTGASATMFIVDLPDPAVCIERVLDTIDNAMPGGHALVRLDGLRVPADQILGEVDQGFKYAQVRLAPARSDALHALARRCDSLSGNRHGLRDPPQGVRQATHRS